MRDFLKRWLINTVAVLVATQIVPGIDYDRSDWPGLLLATLVLGILNTFIKPLLVLVSLPLVLFSLGLFMIVINAVLLSLVGALFPNFHVSSFGTAIVGALVISFVSLCLNALTGGTRAEIRVQRGRRRRDRNRGRGRGGRRDDDDGGGGPVIDV
jgi:putative membrane protein